MFRLTDWWPFIIQTVSCSFAVYITARLLPGIHVRGIWSAFWVSLTYGFLNYVAYEVFGFLSVTFGMLTLGIGFWLINAILLLMTNRIVSGFKVKNFFWAGLGSLMIVVLTALLVRFLAFVANSQMNLPTARA